MRMRIIGMIGVTIQLLTGVLAVMGIAHEVWSTAGILVGFALAAMGCAALKEQ